MSSEMVNLQSANVFQSLMVLSRLPDTICRVSVERPARVADSLIISQLPSNELLVTRRGDQQIALFVSCCNGRDPIAVTNENTSPSQRTRHVLDECPEAPN